MQKTGLKQTNLHSMKKKNRTMNLTGRKENLTLKLRIGKSTIQHIDDNQEKRNHSNSLDSG